MIATILFPTLFFPGFLRWTVQFHLALHIPDGFLSPPISIAGWVVALAAVSYIWRVRPELIYDPPRKSSSTSRSVLPR